MATNLKKAEENLAGEILKQEEHDLQVQEAKDAEAACVTQEEEATEAVRAAKTEINQSKAALKELQVTQLSYSSFVLIHLGRTNCHGG